MQAIVTDSGCSVKALRRGNGADVSTRAASEEDLNHQDTKI
jgi:hypothetical protein